VLIQEICCFVCCCHGTVTHVNTPIFQLFVLMKEFMETMNMSDKQGMEICENVDRMLVDELDTEDVWKKVQDKLTELPEKQQHR
jgi:hypothetical protein